MKDKVQQGKVQEKTVQKKEVRHGIPMSPESLAEYEQTWKDMEECISYLDKSMKQKTKKR